MKNLSAGSWRGSVMRAAYVWICGVFEGREALRGCRGFVCWVFGVWTENGTTGTPYEVHMLTNRTDQVRNEADL